jgi:hypothetical protein
MATYSNPFSFLINALWEALESNTNFTDLVKEANRIKLDSGFRPFKSTLVESSVPEVCILPVGKRLFEEAPCDGATIVQSLHITVATGRERTSDLLDVEWRVIQTIAKAIYASTGHLQSLTWNAEQIIKNVNILPMEEGLTNDEVNRELRGWAAILPLEVKMFFTNSLLGVS